MKAIVCYLLLILLALPATGSVHAVSAEQPHSASVIDPRLPTDTPDTGCHSVTSDHSLTAAEHATDHSCCDTEQHYDCNSECCSKHCTASSAIITASLHLPQPDVVMANPIASHLPFWLFFHEPPPPVNA